jgi:hypothetical protein
MEMFIRNVDTFVHGEVRVTFDIWATHWFCSIATAHKTAPKELHIIKFAYYLVMVPCGLPEEEKFEVLKLHI